VVALAPIRNPGRGQCDGRLPSVTFGPRFRIVVYLIFMNPSHGPPGSGNSSAPAAHRLLIIDDDAELCALLGEYLGSSGFSVEAIQDAEQGVRRALSGEHVIVVLDVMLPRIDGFEVLRRIRAQSAVPVLMLTARGDDVDRIVGLEIGADDYLPKPFNPRGLVARLHAILRRARGSDRSAAPGECLVVGDVELDLGARLVRCGSRRVDLTGAEFLLLEELLRAAGRVVGREQLSQTVLGRSLAPFDRSIDVHVSNLRKKLGPGPQADERIKAVRGSGYVYLLPPGTADSRSAT
jgi:DNA-binding response OmpR family regulator